MKHLNFSIYLFSLLFSLGWAKTHSRETLRFSQVIFRHGNRNPEWTYGKYTEDFNIVWPEGKGGLTNIGKKQAFELGRFFRETYHDILSPAYIENEILVLSSAGDRAVKSAHMSMMGLYESYSRGSCWTEGSSIPGYEPIPVRTIPSALDHILDSKTDCPKREKRTWDTRRIFNAKYFDDQGHRDLFEYVLTNSGQPSLSNPNATTLEQHIEFYSAVEVTLALLEQNKPLEEWMIPLVTNKKILSYNYFLTVEEVAADVEAQRINTGSLIELIEDNFRKYSEGVLDKKVIFFSGHDRNIISYMLAVNISSILEDQAPPPASCLLLELHEVPEHQEHVVQFWYRNAAKKQLQNVISPKCGNPCTIQKLHDITSHLFLVDYEEECRL